MHQIDLHENVPGCKCFFMFTSCFLLITAAIFIYIFFEFLSWKENKQTGEMENPVIFITPEISANSTTDLNVILDSLNICVYSVNVLFGLPTHSYDLWFIITGKGN